MPVDLKGESSHIRNVIHYLLCQTEEVEEPIEEDEEAEKKDEEKKDEDKKDEDDEDDDAKVEEEKEDKPKTKKVSKTVWDWELMNSVKPIWTRK